jgi:protein-S-isoprenylcysteine O-methyltransferase Ste14
MKLKIDVANYFLVLIILNIILHYLVHLKQIIFFPYNLIGIVLFIAGWIPNIWMGIYFRKIGTTIPAREMPKKLVINYFFRISRNPVYLGMVISLFGEAIFLGSLVAFIIPILFFILINQINIPIEERNLEKQFGKKYLEYKKKVGRWV